MPLPDNIKVSNFEDAVLPHIDSAFNLARWLTRDDADADDVVQESYLRAFKYFGGFRGGDSRAWLLKIVRNTCYSWMQKNRDYAAMTEFDEEQHGSETCSPETMLIENIDSHILKRLIEELPVEFREVVILRDIEGLSYKEIANVADLPLGTVMSRLARARQRLQSGGQAMLGGVAK